MTRNAIFVGILAAAACGGKSPPPDNTLGSTHVEQPGDQGSTTTTSTTTTTSADPALAFRMAYSNSGGMWMPQQMTLPGHVETFKNMGVQMPASTLADPLAAP